MPEPIPLAGIPPAEEGLLGAPDVSLQSPAAEKVGAQGRDTDGWGGGQRTSGSCLEQ